MPKYRRTDYDGHWHPIIAALLGERGAIDEEVASVLGVGLARLYTWKNDHPEFREALATGKHGVDTAVEGSLLERALGYDIIETTSEFSGDAGGMVETKRVVKSVPADTVAMIFWLKNRRPEQWRDRRELDVSGTLVDVPADYSQLSDDELRQAAALARKAGRTLTAEGSNGNGHLHS